jgi:hypothetical protein
MLLIDEQQLNLPRLTGTLKAFSNISKLHREVDDYVEREFIRKRLENIQRKKASASVTDSLSPSELELKWPLVLLKLIPNNNDSKVVKLKSFLDKLRNSISKQFLNEDFNDTELLNEAALFIFEVFYEFANRNEFKSGSTKSNFQNLDKLNKRLKERFGQFARNLFDTCKDLMESLFNEIDELNKWNELDDLFGKRFIQLNENQRQETHNDDDSSYFGENIKFTSKYDTLERYCKAAEAGLSTELLDEELNESDIEEEEQESESESDDGEIDRLHIEFPMESNKERSALDEENENLKYIRWTADLSNEICNLIYELLSSKSNHVELQNELVELLSFDKIELAEYLYSNKEKVTEAFRKLLKDNVNSKASLLSKGTLSSAGDHLEKNSNVANANRKQVSMGDALRSEITVHTETEKKIKKLMRKEEKKLNKLRNTGDDSGNEMTGSASFDPKQLKKLREDQLNEAKQLQIYYQRKLGSMAPLPSDGRSRVDDYPYVFDSMLKISQTSAFISGSKILLPENIHRTNTGFYEEIAIPPSNSFDSFSDEMRVQAMNTKEYICFRPFIQVSELDELGQVAFRNVKALNRIQSIVYEAAYQTNQNLLICAPTGAGKTNIAMLTIINLLRMNFVEGVIRKDDFKIVYVAPMKALAAEMVENFSKRLQPLGISVRELTGDMQLTKQELAQTQMIVTTPEKWDVVTRKSQGDISLSLLVRLLIIDEVHLLHDERGSVIETIVARTLRQVESSQKMIRIVGLSATLPNYFDVARFLNVNPRNGLFFFDSRFRPVPLAQTFLGVKSPNKLIQQQQMDEACYEKALRMLKQGHQVMVFVHSRNATLKTAEKLRQTAKGNGEIDFFRVPEQSKEYGEAQKQMSKSRNKQLREIFDDGFAVHHAGKFLFLVYMAYMNIFLQSF